MYFPCRVWYNVQAIIRGIIPYEALNIKEDSHLKKKNQRGFMGYVVLIASFIIIALILNGGFGQQLNLRIEYP